MSTSEKKDKILALLDSRTNLPPAIFSIDDKFPNVNLTLLGKFFSAFDDNQVEEASKIIEILLDEPDFNNYIDLVANVRDIDNDGLFLYVLYTSVLHRDDCRCITMPPIEECAPHWFFSAETIHEAIQRSIHQTHKDHYLINQKTAESSDPESRLAYFREDIGVNSHHWAWHVTFPSYWKENRNGGKVKNRKGELFYYMHQQMLARYFCERLSNGLNRVTPLVNFREPLEGYSSHLTSVDIGVHFGSRSDGLVIQNFDNRTVEDLELWRGRIYDAIDQKFVQDAKGKQIHLEDDTAIDILGAIVESSFSSVNRTFYGNLHNSGHVMISQMHDPGRKRREHSGVMGFQETAVRDPVFFRWHTFIDDIFYRHKSLLKPYTKDELMFEGIKVISANVSSHGHSAGEKNVLRTLVVKDRTDLSHAPFLKTNKKIWVEYERQDHEPFSYEIEINNTTRKRKSATIRIFIGPKNDEFGKELDLNERRRYMIELDKFEKKLAAGLNKISRRCVESSVTLPRSKISYETLKSKDYNSTVDYCSCGWPEHLLIPRGTHKGMDFVLFVMCTNAEDDKPSEGTHPPSTCSEHHSRRPQGWQHRGSRPGGSRPGRSRYGGSRYGGSNYGGSYPDESNPDESQPDESYHDELQPDASHHDESQPDASYHDELPQDAPHNHELSDHASTPSSICNSAVSYCGSKDQKYPDTKPMGYPFDRIIEQKTTLKDFRPGNMYTTDVKIQFLGKKQDGLLHK